jgi:hypothetical protein
MCSSIVKYFHYIQIVTVRNIARSNIASKGFIVALNKLSCDRLCDIAVRVPGYRSRGPGSIPGATRFSET